MIGWQSLAREYEQKNFPPTRRLDLQAEGPATARQRALRWIQMWAHELPGAELLLVTERVARPGSGPGPVSRAVESLLRELDGGLIEWWQEFGMGSMALRIAEYPERFAAESDVDRPSSSKEEGDGRTPETAGVVTLAPEDDIPPELLPAARRAAELRREREGLSVGVSELVLREVWLSAQALAMEERVGFDHAVGRLLAEEERLAYGD